MQTNVKRISEAEENRVYKLFCLFSDLLCQKSGVKFMNSNQEKTLSTFMEPIPHEMTLGSC